MLPRLLFLLPLALVFSFQALAQTYEPGFLVRSNGDTLKGEIENGFWVESPEFIRYRPDAGAPGQLYEPRQLRTVSFTGGRKFSYEALLFDHAAKTRLDDLPRFNYYDTRVDTLLAEVLLEGPVPLRRVVWNDIPHYLLRRPNQPVLDLSERRYLRETGTGTLTVTDGNNFRSQLLLFFGDCPAATAAAATAPFTVDGIVGVVQAYNQTCAPERQPTRSWLSEATPRRRLAFQAGALAGVRYNRIESSFYDPTGGCVDCRPHPSAGLYAELFQPSRTMAVYGELSLSTFRSQEQLLTSVSPTTGPEYSTAAYGALLATARLGVRHYFPLRNEHQWLVSFIFELNKTIRPGVAAPPDYTNAPFTDGRGFATTTLLPAFGLGWRKGRLTVSADIQTYTSSNAEGFGGIFFGSNFALRTGLSYRFGGNPDEAPSRATKR